VVVRQIDGGTPQPAQRFNRQALVQWIEKQLKKEVRIYACYEACGLGFSLQRQLSALGVTCYVVRGQDWDEHGAAQKTDARDAKALCLRLERYVRGNTAAFSIVRVPSEAEEQARSLNRQRDQLVGERKRLQAIGKNGSWSKALPVHVGNKSWWLWRGNWRLIYGV
jgi:transposase